MSRFLIVRQMQKILSYPLSAIYYILLGLTLAIFHPLQWLCLNLFGYQAHKKCVDMLCFFLVANTYVLGTRYKIENLDKLPENSPLIIVANHQSFYDITSIAWFLRKVHIKFVSKIELGKGIPSISYFLRHGGSALINRNDPKQALTAIKKTSEYIEEHKRSVVIFPEGTRSNTGKPAPFVESGLKILCKYAPSAYVVPLTINNAWKITRWGVFPLGLGTKIKLTIHNPISVKDTDFTDIFKDTQRVIIENIEV